MSHRSNPLTWPRTWTRALVIALLVAAMAMALWPGTTAPTHLVVLVDESASMPSGAVNLAWDRLRRDIDRLPTGSRLSLVRFASAAVTELDDLAIDDPAIPETMPRRLPLDPGATNLATAIPATLGATLASSLGTTSGTDAALVLVISDGGWGPGDWQRVSRALGADGTPLIWWNPTTDRSWPDAAVDALSLTRSESGEPEALVLLRSTRPSQLSLVLTIDEEVIHRSDLNVGASGIETVSIPLPSTTPGTHALVARAGLAGDSRPANDSLGRLIRAPGPPGVLLVSSRPASSPVARSLGLGGWSIQGITPDAFDPAELATARVLILDGIQPAMLSDAHWRAIDSAVTRGATGLLVLGGPGTFGAGSYRHSILEGLLPVTAEAPERRRAATVLYALDKSGSMAQPTRHGRGRLELALEAVLGSAHALGERDRAALLAFDAEAQDLLPLGRRSNQGEVFRHAWDGTPGGGTRLAPLVARVLEMLTPDAGALQNDQRILVLVSDGQVSDADQAQSLGRRLAAAGVTPVVLGVGDPEDAGPLAGLARAAGGRFHQVSALPALPILMESELQGLRDPVERGLIQPIAGEPLPFPDPPAAPWPMLAAYPLMRPKPGASVHLQSPLGDPLLVSGWAGAGPVMVLPAGLGDWAPDWPAWPGWGRLLAGSLGWLAGGEDSAAGWIEPRPGGGYRLGIEIDPQTSDGTPRGQATGPINLRLIDPLGRRLDLAARPLGLDRLEAPIDQAPSGRYRGVIDAAGSPRLDLWYRPGPELDPVPPPSRDSPHLEPWSPDPGSANLGLPLPRRAGTLAPGWVLAAMALFTALLIFERLPLQRGQMKGRLRAIAISPFTRHEEHAEP